MQIAQVTVAGQVDQSALAGAGDQFEQNVVDSLDVLGLLGGVRVERMAARYEILRASLQGKTANVISCIEIFNLK